MVGGNQGEQSRERAKVLFDVLGILRRLTNEKRPKAALSMGVNDLQLEYAYAVQSFPSLEFFLRSDEVDKDRYTKQLLLENEYRNLYLFLQGVKVPEVPSNLQDAFREVQKLWQLHMGLFAYVDPSQHSQHGLRYLYGPGDAADSKLSDAERDAWHFHIPALYVDRDDTKGVSSITWQREPSQSFYDQARHFYYARMNQPWTELDFVQILQARRGSRWWYRRTAFESNNGLIYASSGEMDACTLCWLLSSLGDSERHSLRDHALRAAESQDLSKSEVCDEKHGFEFRLLPDNCPPCKEEGERWQGVVWGGNGTRLRYWREGESRPLMEWLECLGLLVKASHNREQYRVAERGWRLLSWLYYYLHNLRGRRLPVLGNDEYYYRLISASYVLEVGDVLDFKELRKAIMKAPDGNSYEPDLFGIVLHLSLESHGADSDVGFLLALNDVLTEMKIINELPPAIQQVVALALGPNHEDLLALPERILAVGDKLSDIELARMRKLTYGTRDVPIVWGSLPDHLRKELLRKIAHHERPEHYLHRFRRCIKSVLQKRRGQDVVPLAFPVREPYYGNVRELERRFPNFVRLPEKEKVAAGLNTSWLDGLALDDVGHGLVQDLIDDDHLGIDQEPTVFDLLQAVAVLLSWSEPHTRSDDPRWGRMKNFQKRARFNIPGHLVLRAGDRGYTQIEKGSERVACPIFEHTSRAWLVWPVRYDENPASRIDHGNELLPVGFFLGTFKDSLDTGLGLFENYLNERVNRELLPIIPAIRTVVDLLAEVENREIYEAQIRDQRLILHHRGIIHELRNRVQEASHINELVKNSKIIEPDDKEDWALFYYQLTSDVEWVSCFSLNKIFSMDQRFVSESELCNLIKDLFDELKNSMFINQLNRSQFQEVHGIVTTQDMSDQEFRTPMNRSQFEEVHGIVTAQGMSDQEYRIPMKTLEGLLCEVCMRNPSKYADLSKPIRVIICVENIKEVEVLVITCCNAITLQPRPDPQSGKFGLARYDSYLREVYNGGVERTDKCTGQFGVRITIPILERREKRCG